MDPKNIMSKKQLIEQLEEIIEDFQAKLKRTRSNSGKRGANANLRFLRSIQHHLLNPEK